MPITIQQLESIANASLNFYLKGPALSQAIQDKPLMDALKKAQKKFPGGRGEIRGNVKANYLTSFMGYSDDDTVTYVNPSEIKQFNYTWKEMHAGITVTFTELKKDGISVVDSATGEKTSEHTDRDETVLTGIFEDKLEDMSEGAAQSFNEIMWRDGTQGSKLPAGVTALVTDDPTVGVVGGIDGAVNTWWRNRSLVGANKITSSPTNQTLTKKLRSEVRQLRRYGGRPKLLLAGSGFLEKLEAEVAEKGIYTQEGFANNGKNDIGMADISMRGVGSFMYDPTLDDLGKTNFCYFLDLKHLYPMVMEGEDMVMHNPARPAEKYVLYRGVTWTGNLICRKRNAHGVYEAA